MFWFILLLIATIAAWAAYYYFKVEDAFYLSDEFRTAKHIVQGLINDINDLNSYIQSLESPIVTKDRRDLGQATFANNSNWNFKQSELSKTRYESNVVNCSRQVLSSAGKKPFEYFCKYFEVPKTEETLDQFEELFNHLSSVDEGTRALLAKKQVVLNEVRKVVPSIILLFGEKRLERELGLEPIYLSDYKYPKFIFQYVSAGGNKSEQRNIIFNTSNTEAFISYLNDHIKKRKTVEGQRALMTSKLRREIKERDNYTCCKCGNSIYKEPNLLLEIDHIVPLAKGGLTEESNLQTLCWKCNRSKGAKLEDIKGGAYETI